MSALRLFNGPQDGLVPRTAPRFSATACAAPAEAVEAGADTRAVLREIGLAPGQVDAACQRLTLRGGPA
jgi:crotonobetainyl-CoA:carnitine CoA-transferase CaiB-like acyl-CoA transferase